MLKRIFAGIMTMTISAFALTSPKLPIIAVASFEGRKIDSTDARTIADALSDNLVQTKKVRVIERSQINQILLEQGFQNSGACDNQSCAIEIGKLLGANRIIIGSISRIGRSYAMFAKLVDVQSGEIIRSSQKSIEGRIESVLTDIVPDLANELVGIQNSSKNAHKKTESGNNDISIDAEASINEVNNIGIVIADNSYHDSLAFSPKFYIVNNSQYPISQIKFSVNLPRDFPDIICESIYAPGCESMITKSKNGYILDVACSMPEIDMGGVWPKTKDGMRLAIKSSSNFPWKRKKQIGIEKLWGYHPEITIIK